jgi:hypothetical protein
MRRGESQDCRRGDTFGDAWASHNANSKIMWGQQLFDSYGSLLLSRANKFVVFPFVLLQIEG